MTRRLNALEFVDLVLDEDSFVRWDREPVAVAVDEAYAADLQKARDRTGLDEAVVTGAGRINGRSVAVLVGEFGFLAGSVGVAAAERLVAGVERATVEGLPLLAAPASGGTRMQEGTIAFLQMVKISAAVARHKASGMPYLVYLRHPTTGGVLASWGSLGHVTVAEPGALVGLIGPRVYEAMYGEPFPPGVQVSENLYKHGLIDAVLTPEDLATFLGRALNVLSPPGRGLLAVPEPDREPLPDVAAWDSITRSRHDGRPGVRLLLCHAATNVVPLNATEQGEADPGLLLALARFGVAPCVLLGQDRRGQTNDRPMGPVALRDARRGMRLAHELRLPLVSVIDTPGAALSQEAEQGGMAREIARSLAELVMLDAPTVSVLLGQGTGAAALALVPADRAIAAQHGWLSPLPPEGASAIVHRDPSRAAEMAAKQGVRSLDLLRAGVIDRIVAERPDARDEPEAFCRRMGQVLEHELVTLLRADPADRLVTRLQRYRRLGR